MNNAILIIGIYVALLIIAYAVSTRKRKDPEQIEDFFFAGRSVGAGLLTPSIFNSWVWTTSIIGAAEAGVTYGISGGMAYGLGAGAAFVFFYWLLITFRKKYSGCIFISEFIRDRFSERTRTVFYALSIMIVLYIIVEMAAGIGFVFNGLFGVSFRIVAFTSIMIAVVFVLLSGIRGVFCNDAVNFCMIVCGIGIIAYVVLSKFDFDFIYAGLVQVRDDPTNPNYNESVLKLVTDGSFQYFVSAVLVGTAQLIVDPSYYLKAYCAADKGTVKKSFLLGGVLLFIPTTILSSVIFGSTFLALGYSAGSGNCFSTLIAASMLRDYFSPQLNGLFGLVMFAVALTTIISGVAGIMSLAALDIYPNVLRQNAKKEEMLTFGRTFAAVIGVIGALIAISLENISLLHIDIFCGILFSAVTGVILFGFLNDSSSSKFAVIGTVVGVVAGFAFWVTVPFPGENYFYGTLASFVVPFVFLQIIAVIEKCIGR